MSTILQKSNHWNVHLILAVAGTTGIVGLFLPFIFGISPLNALQLGDYVDRLAAIAFLSVLETIATTRWIILGSFSIAEKAIAYFFVLVATGLLLSVIFNPEIRPSDFLGVFTFAIPLMILISGAYFVFRKFRTRGQRETRPLMAMQVVYIANCLFYLASTWAGGNSIFPENWQIGAYFCLVASTVYLIQIALFLTQRNDISFQPEKASLQ